MAQISRLLLAEQLSRIPVMHRSMHQVIILTQVAPVLSHWVIILTQVAPVTSHWVIILTQVVPVSSHWVIILTQVAPVSSHCSTSSLGQTTFCFTLLNGILMKCKREPRTGTKKLRENKSGYCVPLGQLKELVHSQYSSEQNCYVAAG
jgi:hypothetical protein